MKLIQAGNNFSSRARENLIKSSFAASVKKQPLFIKHRQRAFFY